MKLAPEQFERILRALQGPPVGHDKRRAERFLVSTTIEFARPCASANGNGSGHGKPAQAWGWTAGISRDVSELGMGLITTAPAERGSRIVVKLPDGAGGWMMLACNVVHCRAVAEGLISLGLEFVEELKGDQAPQPPAPAAATRAATPSKSCCGSR